MYKHDISQTGSNRLKQSGNKSKIRQSKEISIQDNKSRQFKQNDSKHLNAIRPYVIKQRKNSKRQIRPVFSSHQMSRSKSKKIDDQSRIKQQSTIISSQNILSLNPSQNASSKQLTQIYQQLSVLKKQYKFLKNSYNTLIKEKQDLTSRQEQHKQCFQKQKSDMIQQLQKTKKSNQTLQVQMQRIKRECFKILESQKFKNKKLQQTIQQKDLMISFLRAQNQLLKKNKDLNASQKQNVDKLFFLQNSAPIFSYESYARLSANNSMISGANNVFIDEDMTPKAMNEKNSSILNRKSQYQQDSLSFSRQKSKQFQSVHSLLSNNNDQTILTFTKKDVFVLDQSAVQQKNNKEDQNNSSQKDDICLTFENRKKQGKQIISFQNLKSKKMLYKSQPRIQGKKIKSAQQKTRRLEIATDQFMGLEKYTCQQQQNSCQTKKKYSKSKGRNSKKYSKNEGFESSIINEGLHTTCNKKNSQPKGSSSKRK